MSSILTNGSAMAALSTLRSISASLDDTQSRISSGLRVGGASDNAAYWSIATTMRSDNASLSAVQDALGLGAAKVDTAYSGMNAAIDVVKEIKAKLTAATEDGVDKTKIQEEISQLQDQLGSIAEAASFSGENWLQADVTGGTDVDKSVVASFVRDSSGAVSVKKVDYTLTASNVLFDTTGNTGLLDQTQNINGDGVVVNVNDGGVTTSHNLKSYTTAQVSAAVTGAGGAFDAGGSIAWTVAGDGAGAGVGYVMIGSDTWVAATEQSAAANATQEVFATDASGFEWQIDVSAGAAAGSTAMSVSDFTIDNTTTDTQLAGLLSMVDTALKSMTSAASQLGSLNSRIGIQEEFISNLTDSIDKGIGRLVDADLNEESTRLKALQTQQQLAIQSLSIANSSSQNVLSLFR